jgi:hypothetical protein
VAGQAGQGAGEVRRRDPAEDGDTVGGAGRQPQPSRWRNAVSVDGDTAAVEELRQRQPVGTGETL